MRNHTRHTRQRGAALVIGLILLAIITLLAVVGMNVSNSELQSATSEQLRLRAFQAAETGIENAMLVTIFKVPASKGAIDVSAATGITGSPVNPDDGSPLDKYKTTVEYCGDSVVPPDGFNDKFTAFHYSVYSEGSSARGAVARHKQGAYRVNQSAGQQSFAPLPVGGGGGCTVAP